MVIKQLKYIDNMPENVVPEEVQFMAKMQKTGRAGLVGLINYRRYHKHKKHRIYQEFCPYGDLDKLVKRYRAWRYVHVMGFGIRCIDLASIGGTCPNLSYGILFTILLKRLQRWSMDLTRIPSEWKWCIRT